MRNFYNLEALVGICREIQNLVVNNIVGQVNMVFRVVTMAVDELLERVMCCHDV